MQLKKMREVLPTLYESRVNKGQSSLTTSPKQASVSKSNPRKAGNENCIFGYQKTEESEVHQRSSIKCSCVQETSVPELLKQKWQEGEDDHYVCSKYRPNMPSLLNFVINPAGASDTENKEKMSPSKTLRTFRLKNFQPDKYYCDKCRFSTKDPLQCKKHLAQHEAIKFICSLCNCVSYTKGEFQRHLVKHTGRFPYQCNYCEYGAVRHDYIVKHTRRVHGTATDKQVMLTVAKAKQKTNCLLKQNPVRKVPAMGAPPQKKCSGLSLNRMTSGIQDEIPETACSTGDAECSQGTAYIQDKYIYKSSDVKIQKTENAIIEVEVYSAEKKPIMPEMPLTVVAPPKFVVPPNCLAQIVGLKKVNGTQHLILKLIPPEEITFRPMKCKETESGNQRVQQGEKTNRSLSTSLEEACDLDNEYKNSEYPSSSVSTTLNCNLIDLHEENVICKENAERGYDPSPSAAVISPDGIHCLEHFQKRKRAKNKHIKYNLDPSIYLASSSSEGKNISENNFSDAVQENNRVPHSSVFDKMQFAISTTEREQWNKFRAASETHLFDSTLFYPSERVEETQQSKSLPLDGSKNVLGVVNGENLKNKCNYMEFAEAQNRRDEGESLEGPVISSVFSLSAGAANVPEGIKWDNVLHKKSPTSLLCRKIAQLMSAVESNMKSQLDASLRHDKSQDSKEKVLSAPDKKYERNALTAELDQEFLLLPQRSNAANSSNKLSNKQEPPLEILTEAITKTRVTNKMHVASPIFIPQGTVLRVLNCASTESQTGGKSGNEMLPSSSTYCNETFLPRPVPYCVFEKRDKHIFLPTEDEVNEVSRNQRVSQRHRTERDSIVKNNSQQNRVLPLRKGDDLNTPPKRVMRGEELQDKDKQIHARENLTKKRLRTQEDCFLKVVPVLMRHLRIIPYKSDQLIKCPHRNQPVVVLNHPDVDSPEIINVMKVINKYKCNVLKAVLSERTVSCLGVKRHHKKLTFQNFDTAGEIEKQNTLKMKLKKTHKNSYKVVNSSPEEASKLTFKCWFCCRSYVDQEEWISHGQKHLMEATRGWDILSFSLESGK
ncbi:zinc finger protein 518B [Elgaria multicarinata webbii]|uniref:zinc finger protein 518B n=1 Tax=Elgaria multicarinata webbii TaxID=159646 RepID=UPI002FCD5FD8